MNPSTEQYIDLDRFPFVSSGTPEWQRLVNIHKNALEANGASIMKGAIKQDILKRMATEADIVLPESYACRDSHNPFLDKDDLSLPDDHPRRQKQSTSLNSIPYDIISVSYTHLTLPTKA